MAPVIPVANPGDAVADQVMLLVHRVGATCVGPIRRFAKPLVSIHRRALLLARISYSVDITTNLRGGAGAGA